MASPHIISPVPRDRYRSADSLPPVVEGASSPSTSLVAQRRTLRTTPRYTSVSIPVQWRASSSTSMVS